MPIRPYNASNVFNDSGPQPSFRAKNNLLGDLLPATMDYQSLIDQLPSTILQLYQAGNQAEVQNQLLQLNITRAQNGQAPITLAMVGGAALTGPQVSTTVGIDPQLQQTLLYGGAAIIGVVLLTRMKKSRRRK